MGMGMGMGIMSYEFSASAIVMKAAAWALCAIITSPSRSSFSKSSIFAHADAAILPYSQLAEDISKAS
ncbi:hypothetical protein Sjap_005227 [Stephania japonica]|uniref:Uncharacterized protein n=1 Tax=Stephania japonica TaxID=461633 RepID=A0AAP0K522_9MAGN